MSGKSPLESLYELEFESLIEPAVRYIGVSVGAAFFYLNHDSPLAIWWAAGVILCHLACFKFLIEYKGSRSAMLQALAAPIIFVLMVSVMWYPLYQVVVGPMAAVYGAGGVILCFFLYGLVRLDTSHALSVLWLLAMLIVVSIIFAEYAGRAESTAEVAGMGLATAAVAMYFVLALYTRRGLSRSREIAAARSSEEQKQAAMGQLAQGIAKDFKSLMTDVTGNLELSQLAPTETDRATYMAKAIKSARKAGQLVDGLLGYSDQSPGAPEPVEASRFLEDAFVLFRRVLPEHVHLDVDGSADPLWFIADRDHLTTGLVNLLLNAADAMPKGGLAVLSASRRRESRPFRTIDGTSLPAGTYVSLSVTDEGSGIAPEILPRVADPFFTTKPEGSGAGLGLSSLLALMHRLGGGLLIQSRRPGGTRVEILIPEQPRPSERVSPAPVRLSELAKEEHSQNA